jgi:hypothetical protein
LLEQWDDIKFRLDDINEAVCTHCGAEEKYKFDDMPNFFPKSWFR